jgi:hypothetical protein
MRKFRRLTIWDKCYVIGALLFVVWFIMGMMIGALRIVPQSFLTWSILATAPLLICAAGVGFEFAPKVRSIWSTTIGKIVIAFFSALCVFIADLFGRVLIYKVTSENPDAFPSARTALIWIFTPLLWIFGFYACVMVAFLVSYFSFIASLVWSLVSRHIHWLMNALTTRMVFTVIPWGAKMAYWMLK